MTGQFNHKDKYLYDNHMSLLNGATVTPVPFDGYKPFIDVTSDPTYSYCLQKKKADSFIDSVQSSSGSFSIDDIFQQKLTLTQDRTSLIINDIMGKESLHKQNLVRLYDDLLMIDNWKIQRPYPENYLKDKTWMDFNKMELQIRDLIRRELKDSMKAVSFDEKDLREALLDFKKQYQKTQMMGSMLEDTINDHIPGEDNKYNITGDLYRI